MNTPSKKSTITMQAKELSSSFSGPSDNNKNIKFDFHRLKKDVGEKNNDWENDDSEGDLFRIQSKPSTTSTTPSTDNESENSSDDDEGSIFVENLAGTDINYEYYHGPCPSLSSLLSLSSSSTLSFCSLPDNNNGTILDCDGIVAAATTVFNPRRGNVNANGMHYLVPHSADQLVATLDGIEQEQQNKDNLQISFCRHDSTIGSDSGTISSNQSNSNSTTDALSIAPSSVLASSTTAGTIFSNKQKGDQPQTSKPTPTPAPIMKRRRYVDPKELSFLHHSNAAGSNNNNTYNYKSNNDSMSALPPPTTAFGKGIRKFGRACKNKTLIQRRKEELGQKFGESNGRGATFVKRKTWSHTSANGTYQRKTVVDKVYIDNVYLK